jgi:hypothetical protein
MQRSRAALAAAVLLAPCAIGSNGSGELTGSGLVAKLTKHDRRHGLHVVVTASRGGFPGISATSARTRKTA